MFADWPMFAERDTIRQKTSQTDLRRDWREGERSDVGYRKAGRYSLEGVTGHFSTR